MKRFLYLLILILVLTVSCSQDDVITKIDDDNVTESSMRKIPLKEALKYAEKHYQALYGPFSRGSQREVSDVRTYSPVKTRSSESGEGFYIVNYADNSGFAILSADRRLDPLYAISNEGSLHLADTIHNEGLRWYVNNILNKDIYSLDGEPFNPVTPPFPLDSTLYVVQDEVFCLPLLTDFKANFKQSSPYNKYCFTPTGEQAVTGCAPLAIGTVVGKYRMVDALEGYTFNWDAMDQDAEHDGWSRLFEILGRSSYLHTNYGSSSSGTNKYYYIPTFKKLGKTNTKMVEFDPELLAAQLKIKVATLVRGICSDGGHIWIVDGGYIDKSGPICLDPNEPQKYMFHCIWGWGGNNNGYFKYSNSSLGGSGFYPTFSEMEIIYGYK